ncbi:8-amino-7-oxononanoate synthase [Vibrio sp. 10N.286.49.B3]|uniref:8-amino-7-oxononanoate synthase n=1 Tax=Vibrio sp. 10N.286.49.B3 TaxID=1880855 RepID=UPI000C8402BB|nr:8-amino-7-oxononanoate synthase [Vibrio sp. 10N.286.49.B3]PMH46769.1 8-amino-7-oxononanoate synthase [Vibrio sp. 10N.286.49.B3]
MASSTFIARIEQAVKERERLGLTRALQPLSNANQLLLNDGHRCYSNFASNDYLGLASDADLIQAWQHGLTLYGAGSAASPLVTGFSPAHQNLEVQLCEWLGFESAILFSSGFSANQALIFALLEQQDTLLQDKLNHASLMEAGMLSAATMRRFHHNDTVDLANKLSKSDSALVVTEGVFSMDGDCAPLSDIQSICQQQQAWLMVDDAHGIGVLGEYGKGSCHAAQIKPDILVVTFGKALGLSGAAILCNDLTGEYLTQFARHHVYSTALPPAQAHAISHAITMVQGEQWRRDKLHELQTYYHEALHDLPGYVATTTPIKPFLLASSLIATTVAEDLKKQGCWVTAIRPPTVKQARLRITLSTNHTPQEIKQLALSLRQVIERSQ